MRRKEGCERVVNKENEKTPLQLLIATINTWYKRQIYTLKIFCNPFMFMSNVGI